MSQGTSETVVGGQDRGQADAQEVWIEGPNSVVLVGLEHILRTEWRVSSGAHVPEDSSLACAIYCVDGKDSLTEEVGHIRGSLTAEVPVLVFGPSLDLPLASAALQA